MDKTITLTRENKMSEKMRCKLCNCELSPMTRYSHGVCITCCDENVGKAFYIAENAEAIKEQARLFKRCAVNKVTARR